MPCQLELRNPATGDLMQKAYPVLLVGLEDLHHTEMPYEACGCVDPPCISFVCKYREEHPDTPLVAVVTAESYEAFEGEPWIVPVMHHYIENVDIVVFAVHDELPSVAQFFTRANNNDVNMASLLSQQCLVFPRLHFFTMATAMYRGLNEGDILVPAVTVGDEPMFGLEDRFNIGAQQKCRFILGDGYGTDFQPKTERMVTAAKVMPRQAMGKMPRGPRDKEPGTGVCMPSKTLINLFRSIGESYVASGLHAEDCLGMYGTEAESNFNDLICEYEQYGAEPTDDY